MKKLLMEFIGTFFFILTIVMTGNPFAIAAMLMAWVYIGGFVSGGHYNPAVSLAFAVANKMSWVRAFKYMVAQVLGGFVANVVAKYMNHLGHIPVPPATVGQAFVMELLLAFVLAFVVLVVASAEKYRGNYIFGLAIGFTIPALAYLGTPISGGLFNPAIALGSYSYAFLTGYSAPFIDLAMYVVGALLGGALAALAYNYFYQEENKVVFIID